MFVGCVILKTFRFVKCKIQGLTGCVCARLQEFQVLDPVFTIVLMHINVPFSTLVFLLLWDLYNNKSEWELNYNSEKPQFSIRTSLSELQTPNVFFFSLFFHGYSNWKLTGMCSSECHMFDLNLWNEFWSEMDGRWMLGCAHSFVPAWISWSWGWWQIDQRSAWTSVCHGFFLPASELPRLMLCQGFC